MISVLADPGKDADGKHPPDAAKTVGDEGAAGVVEAWLAVQDHCGQKDNEARNATDDNCLIVKRVVYHPFQAFDQKHLDGSAKEGDGCV